MPLFAAAYPAPNIAAAYVAPNIGQQFNTNFPVLLSHIISV